MTEQEAIRELEWAKIRLSQNNHVDNNRTEAFNMAFEALDEVKQYREIGIPEECRAAVKVKKEITEVVNRQLIAGRNNYKETNNCFYEIAKIIQDNY